MSEDPGLAALLAAAAAPEPESDAGRDESGLEAVLAAYRDAAPASTDGVAVPGAAHTDLPPYRRISRSLMAKCAAVLVIAAGAGIGAASAGVLPSPIQQIAHDYFGTVGIPGPRSAGASPSVSASVSLSANPTAAPESTPAAGTNGPAASSGSPSQSAASGPLATLCGVVVANGKSWRSDVTLAQRNTLIAAAGTGPNVLPYCTSLLASPSASSGPGPSSSAAPSATASSQKAKPHPSKSAKSNG